MAESSSSTSSGLTFKLHPLVILNISDHFTRLNSQMNVSISKTAKGASIVVSSTSAVQARVYGCIIGVQNGRTIEIFNSFELLCDYDSSSHLLHRSFLLKQQELYKKVFPDFYILGWYSTGRDIEEFDIFLHRNLMDINANPVYLLLNPSIDHAKRDLPITIYESKMHMIDGNRRLVFVRSTYTIEPVVAERISVNNIAAEPSSGGSSAATQLADQLKSMHAAIKMLNSSLRLLHYHFLQMQKGNYPLDNSLLRQVLCILRTLLGIESGRFKDDMLKKYNDTLLIAYLAIRTDCLSTMYKVSGELNRMDACTDSITLHLEDFFRDNPLINFRSKKARHIELVEC